MVDNLTYKDAGVDYPKMDAFKRAAQYAALETIWYSNRFGFPEVGESRGESVYLIETPDSYLAHVEEGLGTKNLVADAMYKLVGKSYYDHIAQDTVAMIVNDLATLGALPLSVAMHLAVGDSDWFLDEKRCQDLIDGWKNACMLARSMWGGGETSTLKGTVKPATAFLGGSAIGIIKPKNRLMIGSKIKDGDAIMLVGSSGIHANGLTLARQVARKLPYGYETRMSNGRSYGEVLLDPTIIYVSLIEDCLNFGVPLHYAVNITGHGWRKLMRSPQPFSYIIKDIPEPQPIFTFIQQYGPVDDKEAYGNLNMGAGFALYVAEEGVSKVLEIARWLCMDAFRAGYVEHCEKGRRVVIRPKGLEYLDSTLSIR